MPWPVYALGAVCTAAFGSWFTSKTHGSGQAVLVAIFAALTLGLLLYALLAIRRRRAGS